MCPHCQQTLSPWPGTSSLVPRPPFNVTPRGKGGLVTTLLYLWKFGWDDLIGWCGNYLTCTGLPYRKPPTCSFTHHTRPTDLYLATCAKSLDVEPHSQALVLEGEKKAERLGTRGSCWGLWHFVSPQSGGTKQFRMWMDESLSSFFRRMTFSPDGSLLIVPGSTRSGINWNWIVMLSQL